jgi:hypothetical protein
MGNVVGYSPRGTVSNSSVGSGSGCGGDVEDILRRLGNVETDVSEVRSQVSAILAVIPHLATKADVADVRAAVGQVHADVMAAIGKVNADLSAAIGKVSADSTAAVGKVSADLAAAIGQFKADVAAVETRIIKWIVATVLASAGLAFTIAKFVH